ncbi:unnamed protein product [Protopolystoma xenopodis]|uniref:Uncharacterized protein n=1 Tax=Protopolystoma xenopodis TaxID=117903 RepID=A0A448WIF4_9PLAT|nr:unnamed protein product [Protopolystoma xenopodis]
MSATGLRIGASYLDPSSDNSYSIRLLESKSEHDYARSPRGPLPIGLIPNAGIVYHRPRDPRSSVVSPTMSYAPGCNLIWPNLGPGYYPCSSPSSSFFGSFHQMNNSMLTPRSPSSQIGLYRNLSPTQTQEQQSTCPNPRFTNVFYQLPGPVSYPKGHFVSPIVMPMRMNTARQSGSESGFDTSQVQLMARRPGPFQNRPQVLDLFRFHRSYKYSPL